MRAARLTLVALLLALGAGGVARAQISLSSAADLALRNSPKVKMAQADLAKARASLGEAKDVFVPQVSTNAGYGRSTGAPLGVPVIFSISAQSLVFSFSQPDYIRSARAALTATEHALAEAQIEVVEDATNTYVALDNALQRRTVLGDERDFAGRLVEVANERVAAGVDARIESTKAHRTAAQIKLQLLLLEDEIAGDTSHLAQLTGLPTTGVTTDRSSIPQFARPAAPISASDSAADSEGVAAAFAVADARQHTAFGDRRYLLRPQIALQADYSRVDTSLSSYLAYYPRFEGPVNGPPNSNNALGFELSITVPLLDMTHRSKARESAAEAAHALAEATQQRDLFREGRAKLRNASLELDARAELARLDREMAEDQLEALRVQLQASAANLSGTQATPKDELNAELQERQKYYDVLNAELQLQQTQVNLLRQQGGLGGWIHQSIGNPGQTPTVPMMTPQVNTPAGPGIVPTPATPTSSGAPPASQPVAPPQP